MQRISSSASEQLVVLPRTTPPAVGTARPAHQSQAHAVDHRCRRWTAGLNPSLERSDAACRGGKERVEDQTMVDVDSIFFVFQIEHLAHDGWWTGAFAASVAVDGRSGTVELIGGGFGRRR